MPRARGPMEMEREFHTEKTRARLVSQEGSQPPTRRQRDRRSAPAEKYGLQLFFHEWPAGGGSAALSAPGSAAADA